MDSVVRWWGSVRSCSSPPRRCWVELEAEREDERDGLGAHWAKKVKLGGE